MVPDCTPCRVANIDGIGQYGLNVGAGVVGAGVVGAGVIGTTGVTGVTGAAGPGAVTAGMAGGTTGGTANGGVVVPAATPAPGDVCAFVNEYAANNDANICFIVGLVINYGMFLGCDVK